MGKRLNHTELQEMVCYLSKVSAQFAVDTQAMLKTIEDQADNVSMMNSKEELMHASSIIGACARSILNQLDVDAFINLTEFLDGLKFEGKIH